MTRLAKDKYYMAIAKVVAERSTCLRAKVGAIIVKDDTIIATGYVGSARGEPNCCDVGECERMKLNIPPGERYELCKSVHAEANAIINAARSGSNIVGANMYVYFERIDGGKIKHTGPCLMCARMIKNAGLTQVRVDEIT